MLLGKLRSLTRRWHARPVADRADVADHAFFLFGCARSGTTSLCRILQRAENADCLMEPGPNLNVESRQLLDGQLPDPNSVLLDHLLPRIEKGLATHQFYGEKNVTLTAFIEQLHELFESKLIWVTRDGREVVASMQNWHNEMFGNFYRECEDPGNLSEPAKATLAQLPLEDDTSNYSRPRPRPGDPYYDKWPRMSRHEMLCWYWAFINDYAMDRLQAIPEDRWLRVDYSAPDRVAEVTKAVDFLALRGIPPKTTDRMLQSRINSLADRTGTTTKCSTWQDWSDKELDQFWEIAGDTMVRLGYFRPSDPRQRRHTPDYGAWWKSQTVGHDFFDEIYNDRLPQHQALMAWAEERKSEGKIETVCEVACGHGIGYAEFFADCSYLGVDISEKEIAWCRENHDNPRHRWRCLDFISEPPDEESDLVFCQGSIENVYDMDGLIRGMAHCAKRYIYFTAFKGYFPELDQHVYEWNPAYTCYENRLSVRRTRQLLRELGFAQVEIFPQRTSKPDIPYETVVIASRECED